MLHAKTRKRGIVERLSKLGLSVSYDRVLSVSTSIGNSVTERFTEEEVVCPPKLRLNLFTTAAVDNIDHNPSSTTAKGAFHGTGISLFQHPSSHYQGQDRSVTLIDGSSKDKKLNLLPEEYANVPPMCLPKKDPVIPLAGSIVSMTECSKIPFALEEEHRYV